MAYDPLSSIQTPGVAAALSGGAPPPLAPKPTGDNPVDMTKDIGKGEERAEKEISTLETLRKEIKPPTYAPPPKPMPSASQTVDMWGSLAIAFAGLASLRVRNHATAALNAAAQAINGIKQKNDADADRAFKMWEEESKNALDLANFQQRAYDTAMSQVTQREELALHQGEAQDRTSMAKLNALSAQFQDPQMTEAIRRGGLEAATELRAARQKQAEKLKETEADMKDIYGVRKATRELEQTPEYKQAQAEGDFTKMLEMKAGVVKALSPKMFNSSANQTAPDAVVDRQADAIGTYRVSPLTGVGLRTAYGRQVMDRVFQKYPDYDAREYEALKAAVKDITDGKDSNVVKSFAALRSHLDYLTELIAAIPTDSNSRLTNEAIAVVARQLGNPGITSFETAANIVSDEEVKAILGQGAGALADREKAVNAFHEGATKAQLLANIETIKHLVGGQLGAIDLKYRDTKLKPEQIIPKFLRDYYPHGLFDSEGGSKSAGAPPIDVGSLTPDQKAGTAAIGGMGGKPVFFKNNALVFEDGTPVPTQ
jgi:hypothetical protein